MKKQVTINIAEQRGRQRVKLTKLEQDIARKLNGPQPSTPGGPLPVPQDCEPREGPPTGGVGGSDGDWGIVACFPVCERTSLVDGITAMDAGSPVQRTAAYPYGSIDPPPDPPWLPLIDGDPDTGIVQTLGANVEWTYSQPRTLSGISITQETLEFSNDIGGPGKQCSDHWVVAVHDGIQYVTIAEVIGYATNQSVTFAPTTATRWQWASLSSPYTGSDSPNGVTLYKLVGLGEIVCTTCENEPVIARGTQENIGAVGPGNAGLVGGVTGGVGIEATATLKEDSSWVLPTIAQRILSVTIDSLPSYDWTWDGERTVTFDVTVPTDAQVRIKYIL